VSGAENGILVDVSRIGKRILDGNVLTLKNRTNNTAVSLDAESTARWRSYLMAMKRNDFGKRDRSDSRITGLFKTKRRGLYVGGTNAETFQSLVDKIKAAKSEGKQLTFFLWKSKFEDGPVFSLNVDLEQDRNERPKRKPIEDDDDDDFEEEDEDKDDELFGKD